MAVGFVFKSQFLRVRACSWFEIAGDKPQAAIVSEMGADSDVGSSEFQGLDFGEGEGY